MTTPVGRALVSGAAGFIGGHLSERLVESGWEVHGLSRRATPPAIAVHWHSADLADPQAAERVIGKVKPDVFFHLASHVVGARDLDAVYPTFRDNALSTVNALVALTRTGCRRVVLAGSLEEPDLAAGDPLPSSPYAASKAASRLYGNMFGALYDLPVTHARIFMVYGPRQADLKKVVPYSIRGFLQNDPPRFGSARPVDWIFVEDVVDGLIAAAASDDAVGKTVDLGTGHFTTVRDVITEIARQMDAEDQLSFEPMEERPMEQIRSADIVETQRLIGWQPRIELSEGLRRTIAHYREVFRA